MEKIFDGVINMKDIDEFMEYCNRLDRQSLINLIEGMYVEDIMDQARFEILGKAFELACKELQDMGSTLFDLYDRLDTYYETKDRHEWKKELLERAEEDE